MKNPIITSIIDTDLYKLTMMQAVWRQYPNAEVYYEFKCRNNFNLNFIFDDLVDQIESWRHLRLTNDEYDYLLTLDFMKKDFLDFFKEYRINPQLVSVKKSGDNLHISCRGKWIDTILFELLILPTVNELYFIDYVERGVVKDPVWMAKFLLNQKIEVNNLKEHPNFKFAEFGTRRRFSKEVQEAVLNHMLLNIPDNIVGTSNVKLAQKYNVKPIGTVAHEWTMAHLGIVDNISQAQGRALHVWQQEYGQRLGIALTDTFSTDAFVRDFDFTLARAYDGVRHDSGDPIEFGEKMISHWNSIGIDPRRKAIVFSDGLDFKEAFKIWNYFIGRTGVSFGIGTYLTNDVGINPLNIVMKLLECNGKSCVKLSDVSGKEMGDPEVIAKLKNEYQLFSRL